MIRPAPGLFRGPLFTVAGTGAAGMRQPSQKNLKLVSDLHQHRNLGRFAGRVVQVSRSTPSRYLATPAGMARVASCGPVLTVVDRAAQLATEGAEVADAPVLSGRVERDLYDAARRAAGLPADATQGQVIRYALAVVAGKPNPRSVACDVSRGCIRPPRQEATA
jgi:hypothetical protein